MPLSLILRPTDSEKGIELDVNNIVQVEIEPVTQEVQIEVEHVPCCSLSFRTILQGLGILFSSVFSILSIVFSFVTGHWH